MSTDAWRPVILRNGTLFGYSPRMRFDLVVNIFGLYSTIHNQIRVFGDGLQWRPYLSVQDLPALLFSSPKRLISGICSTTCRMKTFALSTLPRFLRE